MKKGILIFLGLLFLISFVSAQSNSDNTNLIEATGKPAPQQNNTWENSVIEKLNSIISIMNVGILDKLTQIATSLQNIENKNTTVEVNVAPPQVTVEPNITVSSPEVNVEVNPNITLPEKDCKWEKINQIIPIDSNSGNTGGFVLPNNYGYSNVTFKKIAMLYKCDGAQYQECRIMINKPVTEGIDCFIVTCPDNCNSYRFFDISTGCLSKLKEGANNISSLAVAGGHLKEIYVEMEVKPTNC